MSDFIQQKGIITEFITNESWVILSPIELSIKRKIEATGLPLKEWNINIYRGVLTGFNKAFIITGKKKQEILDNCKDEAEKKRTNEIIRPNNLHPIFALHTIHSEFLFQRYCEQKVALYIAISGSKLQDIVS